METPRLNLPLIAAGQAQKHVPANESFKRIDAMVHMAAISMAETDPPAEPAEGDMYVAAAGATGAWTDGDLNIFLFTDGVWLKIVPFEGMLVWDRDQANLFVWAGEAWQAAGIQGPVEIKDDDATALAADRGKTWVADGEHTFTLDEAAELGDGWRLTILARGGDVTVDTSGSEEIDGAESITVPDRGELTIICDGTAFHTNAILAAKNITSPPAYGGAPPGNDLLTAAMVAGGALVAWGENTDGRFWRFESGIQICLRSLSHGNVSSTSSSGGFNRSDIFTANFPAAFTQVLYADVATHGTNAVGFVGFVVEGGSHSNSQWNYRFIRPTAFSDQSTPDLRLFAIGLWKALSA